MSDLLDTGALLDRARRLVDAARKAGADAADVMALRGVSVGVQMREGKVESSERSEGDDLGLRVFVGRRSASVSSNDPREDAAALAERAVAIARVAPEDPYARLADPADLATAWPDLDLIDPVMMAVSDLEALARRAEEAALAVKGVAKSGGASAGAGIGGFALVTSTGFEGASLGSSTSFSVTAIAGEGTGMERDYDYSATRHRADLEAAEAVGARAGERAVRRLNPRKVDTTKVPVVFDPRTAASFPSYLASAANGQSVARKTSFLRDRLGQRIFRPGVSIVDDPHRRRGLRSRPFDGEGVATKPLVLVDDGVLTSWLLDSATAAELGLRTTGHASRGTGGPPSPGATNLHLAAGTVSPKDMIGAITSGLYVTDMIGSGVNMVTGDYSRGCSGYWIENGELAYPVAEITIAGNLVDMFANLTPADDLVLLHGVDAPTVLVEGLTVAGR
ncbi:TldD/PmbA family protein [Phreatobacter oligotrophus]|jgi:PmbA protein|uniref:TldD/PmbA family protein n=1 Tax=Phreatobacter oligotrophus TaxID=1122261 RepID=UPI0023576FE2|nr:TldD/PmbA family protein [Phreatobacter oligotrophus]MBX9991911.1 TldD/PmbA family protein [Phreatobacter oligotrophus]